jgi:GNAT superfamily N-acetyltransferase
MNIGVSKTALSDILPFRDLFLKENNFQVRHERNWSDSYLLTIDGDSVGYGSVEGLNNLKDRDSIFEFFIVEGQRRFAEQLFLALVKGSNALYVNNPSNEKLLTSMLYAFCENLCADVILFEDQNGTNYLLNNVTFRNRRNDDKPFDHTTEPVGDFVLEMNDEIVATGGYFTHYNFPFADLYMEVRKDHRRKGLGTYLLQEIKKECYKAGHVPAARCDAINNASKGVLIDAGMMICGCMLTGDIKSEFSNRRNLRVLNPRDQREKK